VSQENVEVVRSIMEAWNRGDYSAAIERVAPEIRAECALGGDFDGTFEGIARVQEWLARFWGAFQDFHSDVDEYIPAGDDVVISVHHYGRGKTSGAEVEMRNWQVVTVREGKAMLYRVFRTREEAFEAVGRRE
jgi:ketosteroid isomerase-like protein